jgi:hypothetical protein
MGELQIMQLSKEKSAVYKGSEMFSQKLKLIPRCCVLAEKLIVFKIIKQFPDFYGIRRFAVVFICMKYLIELLL